MNPNLLAIAAVLAAYLIGSIPFGYLTALWVRGIDIRTVGSGNIGATNVGRVLGFRFFVLVFVLDLLKGFLPTYAFPKGVAMIAGSAPPDLGVLLALATILGHNFPAYLKLRGGKGVATSLGALLALDWVASVSAAAGFVTSLVVTRYVSLSSLVGGLVFVAAYFGRVEDPWNRDHRAMSVLTIGLAGLLFVRHRKNVARIWAGTEPKVSFRKKKEPPAGRIAWGLVVVLVLAVLGAYCGLKAQAAKRATLALGLHDLVEVARVGTGHQRAERVAFAGGGNLLAVTCPRYDRVVLYRVTGEGTQLEEVRDIALEGKPMAVCATRDRVFVLQRPSGDARHVEPGWWETFDFRGRPVGPKFIVGMYPDDLAITPDGRHAVVLTSGRGEGDADRPPPALDVVDLEGASPRAIGRLEFDRPHDDPCRVMLSATGKCAAVSLLGTDEVAAVDLADLAHPRGIGRSHMVEDGAPHLSAAEDDTIMMAVAPEKDAVLIPWPGTTSPRSGFVACTMPHTTALIVFDSATRRKLGQMPLRGGALNLSAVRPMGLAFAPERGLLAVAGRSGSVHLIAVRPNARGREAHDALAASPRGSTRR